MKLRNSHPAFALDGDIGVEMPTHDSLVVRRTHNEHWAVLYADFLARRFAINCS